MEFQDVPVWALAGRWRAEQLAARLPGQPDLFDDEGRLRVGELPEQLPDRILLLLGQDDLFPYHIDFRRTRSEKPRATPHGLSIIPPKGRMPRGSRPGRDQQSVMSDARSW